jgi:hypothetical protein
MRFFGSDGGTVVGNAPFFVRGSFGFTVVAGGSAPFFVRGSFGGIVVTFDGAFVVVPA